MLPCMQLCDKEVHIKNVYLAGLQANVGSVQRRFRDVFMEGLVDDTTVKDVLLPDNMQMINMTFTMSNFSTAEQGMHRACRAIFVDNATSKSMMASMGFKATRISEQKMRNSIMVEMDRGDAVCLVRVWSNGKFAIMTGARTFPELFTCAKLISVLAHVGAGRSPHEQCAFPIESMNVYLVNVPMKMCLSPRRVINVIRLQRMLTRFVSKDTNLLVGFSVGRNARSNLQQQGNFEVSFVDRKVTLKVFVSSNGNMRVYMATNKPKEMFMTAVEAVANAVAPIVHECVADCVASKHSHPHIMKIKPNNKRKTNKQKIKHVGHDDDGYDDDNDDDDDWFGLSSVVIKEEEEEKELEETRVKKEEDEEEGKWDFTDWVCMRL